MSRIRVELLDQSLIFAATGFPATVADLLRRDNHPLNTRCGQRGLCDGCMIELHRGSLVHRTTGERVTAEKEPILLRGCQYLPVSDPDAEAVVRVPERSLLKYEPQVVSAFRLNVTAGNDPLCGPPEPGHLGAAIDIGTTTVVVMLVDLTTGQVVSSAAGYNKQLHLGDNVLTRISLCREPGMLHALRDAVVRQTLAPLLRQAVHSAHASPQRVRCIAVAGNTTMLHLFAGVDPTPLGVVPFTPVFLEHRTLHDAALDGLTAPVHLLPGCSAYVGADLAAGIVATGQLYEDGPTLLVDIGTNGEIVLKHGEKLYGTATAAGPAFEGSNLACGMRAGAGAVSHVRIAREPFAVSVDTIGSGRRATGVCGSAYVDFLAQARAAAVLSETGRFDPAACPDSHLMPWQDHGLAFRLASSPGKQPVLVSERDVSKLLQAKAAIAAGILILLARAGLTPGDVKRLYLAGGFGMHVSVANAIRCGLLPGFRAEQVQVVGNTSLGGAYLALLDKSVMSELDRLRSRMTILELNQDPEFEMSYIDQLMLP